MKYRVFPVLLVVAATQAHATDILISNFGNHKISRYHIESKSIVGELSNGNLDGPQACLVGPDGKLYVVSENANKILRFDPATGAYIDTFASGLGLNHPTAVAFRPSGEMLVGNFNSNTVARFDTGGAYLGDFIAAGANGLNGPDVGMCFGPDGNLYVPAFNANYVKVYSGTTAAFIGNFPPAVTVATPRTILFHTDGKVYISSDSGNRVLRYTSSGAFDATFVAAGSGTLSGASGMVFHGGFLYVSSWKNNKVLRYDATSGAYVDVFATTGLGGPTYLRVLPEPGLQSLLLTPNPIIGGFNTNGRVFLKGPATSFQTITLSDNTSVIGTPASTSANRGQDHADFGITTQPVTSQTVRTVYAAFAGQTVSANLTLKPGGLASIALNPTTVESGSPTQATISLTGPAPVNGITVTTYDNTSAINTPANAQVAGGASSSTITVATTPVASTVTRQVYASLGSTTKLANLTLVPSTQLASLTLNPTSVKGGSPSTGTVTLSLAAPTGGSQVALSDNTSVIATPAATTVQAGATSVQFTATTSPVSATATRQVYATFKGVTKTAN